MIVLKWRPLAKARRSNTGSAALDALQSIGCRRFASWALNRLRLFQFLPFPLCLLINGQWQKQTSDHPVLNR